MDLVVNDAHVQKKSGEMITVKCLFFVRFWKDNVLLNTVASVFYDDHPFKVD